MLIWDCLGNADGACGPVPALGAGVGARSCPYHLLNPQ